MTYKEAINKLYNSETYDEDMGKAIDMGIEALEKQIPKKPHITHHKYKIEGTNTVENVDFTHCPYCWEQRAMYWGCLVDKGTAYCHRCGQAIDWSEES